VFLIGLVHVLVFLISSEINRSVNGLVITLSLLFVLPASVSALIVFLTDMSGTKPIKHYNRMPLLIMALILLISAFILKEGVICILMISPFWWFASWYGSYLVYKLQEKYKLNGGINSFVLAALPFLTLLIETHIPQQTRHYTVNRSVMIEASAEEVWPLLVKLDNIDAREGRWNFTQNILGVPKPAMATLDTSMTPYIRHARWGDHVTFEEHITAFDVNEKMRWKFVFPNDSVSEYTDRHISADGYHLKIKSGGYELISISPTQTKLILNTDYRATSPVNLYAKLWGEFILGDIQNNILHLIQNRAEKTSL